MGIRIHKMAGWGLKDVRVKDPRFKPGTDLDKSTDLDFIQSMEQNRETIIDLYFREIAKMIPDKTNALQYATSEFELQFRLSKQDLAKERKADTCIEQHGKILLFRPVTLPDWYRFDDSLDFFEETERQRRMKNRTTVFKMGLYPHDHWMVRFRDPPASCVKRWQKKPEENILGESIGDEKGIMSISTGWYNQLVGRWDPKLTPLERNAVRLRHLKEDFRPAIPFGVIALVLWSDLALDPASFLDDLRPMIHVWWD